MKQKQPDPEQTEPGPEAPKRRRKRRHWVWHGFGAGSFVLTSLVVLLSGVALFLASGRPIDAPDWLEARVAESASDTITGAALTFDSLQVVVVDGWKPRLRLGNVRLVTPDGQTIVGFTQLDMQPEIEALLAGEVRPERIGIDGIFASLRRQESGQFVLSGDLELAGPVRRAPNLAALIGQLDALLLSPAMEALDAVDVQALTLRYEDQISDRAWTIDGGRLRLTREGTLMTIAADLAVLSGTAGIATLEANYSSALGSSAARFGVTVADVEAGDIALQSPALSWLQVLRAPISGSLRSGVDGDGALEPLSVALSVGAGALQPTDATRPVPFDSARIYLTYRPDTHTLAFDEVSVESQWVNGQGAGIATLGGMEDGRPDDLVAQLSFSSLAVNPAELYPEPRRIPEAQTDLRVSLAPFSVELGQASLKLGADWVTLKGRLSAEQSGWRYGVDLLADETSLAQVLAYWPETYLERTRAWIAQNISGGRLNGLDVALRGTPGAPGTAYASFDYTEAGHGLCQLRLHGGRPALQPDAAAAGGRAGPTHPL